MQDKKRFSARFTELLAQADELERHKYRSDSYEMVDHESYLTWKTKTKNLIQLVSGRDSEHYHAVLVAEKPSMYSTNLDHLRKIRAALRATQEDFESGFLNSLRSLIHAEVFSEELEISRELFVSGYVSPAAVVAGIVLETALRSLCTDHSIDHGKMDRMNADLAKANVYNNLVQKRITAAAAVRNSAAHGKPEEFTKSDVDELIRFVGTFLSDYL
ncbi:hypothetical protein ABAC460_10300 [Asticcacaulis sp. AC460]|uniref:hypothetical protein n=1 Tax=Asticcacaulis sp. AC460 TaxID=1282360 RepID=UPI0003C40999|nr:hypothetical protein [Asticcacaulis sp. AC460]ESQ90132.1 hypothetical protein ABAC460_10300 [Asticcacaulis sp. AC460]